jgi:hypothetical protein
LLGEDYSPVGWLLGYPIDGEGKFLGEGDTLYVPGFADGTSKSVEQFVYGFGGRFLVALVGVRQPVFTSTAGSLSSYIAPTRKSLPQRQADAYDEQTCDESIWSAR